MIKDIETGIGQDGLERVVVRCRECGTKHATGKVVVRLESEAFRARLAFDRLTMIISMLIVSLVAICGLTTMFFPWFYINSVYGHWLLVNVKGWQQIALSAGFAVVLCGLPTLFLMLKWQRAVRKFPALSGTWDKFELLPK